MNREGRQIDEQNRKVPGRISRQAGRSYAFAPGRSFTTLMIWRVAAAAAAAPSSAPGKILLRYACLATRSGAYHGRGEFNPSVCA